MEQYIFQYTLPSNSSAIYYPENKPNEFLVKVPRPITKAGEWEVFLLDIQSHHAWLTLEQPQYFILCMYPEEARIVDLLNFEAAASDAYYLLGKQSELLAQEMNWSKKLI